MKILLMYSTHETGNEHIHNLQSIVPDAEIVKADNESDALKKARYADIIFGHRYLRQSLPGAERLKWVQSTVGGVDRLPLRALREMDVLLTRMTVASPVIARHAVTMAWVLTRGLPAAFSRQQKGVYDKSLTLLPMPKTSLVFGTGSIGRHIASMLRSHNIAVYGVKKTQPGSPDPDFDGLLNNTSFHSRLPDTDWIFNALPYTTETKHYFDKDLMKNLPSHGVVINVGRGETLVTSDLCELLHDERLGGAGLDVIYPKPKDRDDPVWTTPHLLITPHIAAHYPSRVADMERFCEEQLRRYVKGERLENRVNLSEKIENMP